MKIPSKLAVSTLTALTLFSSAGLASIAANADVQTTTQTSTQDATVNKVAYDVIINDAVGLKPSLAKPTNDNMYGIFDNMLDYNLDPDVLGGAMARNPIAIKAFYKEVLALPLTDRATVINKFAQLRVAYLKTVDDGVYITAIRGGHVYNSPTLKHTTGEVYKANDTFRIQSVYKANGKQRFLLADSNKFVSGYNFAINRDLTGNDTESRMFDRLINVTPTGSGVLAKTYYVKTPKGKKHVAVIKKSVIKHARLSFGDLSSLNKLNRLRAGQRVNFKEILRYDNSYRLKLNDGKYITANKAYVNVIK